jgi:hypothetical protein
VPEPKSPSLFTPMAFWSACHVIAGHASTEGPALLGVGLRDGRTDDAAVHGRRDLKPERIHVEQDGSIFRPFGRSRTPDEPGHDRIGADVLQDGRTEAHIGVDLHVWPRPARRRILGLDADQLGVAGRDAVPRAGACVICTSGRHDIDGAVAPKAVVAQGPLLDRAAVGDDAEARHVAGLRARRVMQQDALRTYPSGRARGSSSRAARPP